MKICNVFLGLADYSDISMEGVNSTIDILYIKGVGLGGDLLKMNSMLPIIQGLLGMVSIKKVNPLLPGPFIYQSQ
jgi:hypothetical protein